MKNGVYYQQGDVLLKPCAAPSGTKALKPGARGYVLAEGEATGHAHRIEDVAGIEFTEKDGKLYITNMKPATIRHEEHKPITLPPGCWEVGKVREYDHFTEEAREVRD